MKTCKNCQTRYTSKFNFCPNCGAKWVDYRLTPRKITNEFTEKYLGTDNVFFKTCLTLFKYPEDVINGYISGQRKKYVNVINFYFISLTLFGLHIFAIKTFAPELLGLENLSVNGENSAQFLTKFFDYMGIITSVFIPLYALAGLIVFYKKHYNFVEHLVFYGYLFGVTNITSFLLTPVILIFSIDFLTFASILSLPTFILIAWYYKRIFQLSFWKAVVKTIILYILYNVISLTVTIITGIIIGIFLAWFSPEILNELNFNINGTQL